MVGRAAALPAKARTAASNSADLRTMLLHQIFGLERLEVTKRLWAAFMVEVVRDPVAKRAAEHERRLQSEMQAHLCGEIHHVLSNLRLLLFAGARESFAGHHADLAQACHELFVGSTPLFRGIRGKCRNGECGRQKAGPKSCSQCCSHCLFLPLRNKASDDGWQPAPSFAATAFRLGNVRSARSRSEIALQLWPKRSHPSIGSSPDRGEKIGLANSSGFPLSGELSHGLR